MAEYSNTAIRLKRAWQAILDAYGDSVGRKFKDGAMPELWKSAVASLTDHQLDRGIRRMVRAGKPHVPTLPEFMRYCREVTNADLDDESPSSGPLPQLPGPLLQQDDWHVASNRHLMRHLFTVLSGNPHAYGPVMPFSAPSPNLGSAEQQANTAILVRWKEQWAQQMREAADAKNEVDIADQRETWAACMSRAEQEIRSARRHVA